MTERGEKLIFREIGARFFRQLNVCLLQLFLTILELRRKRLRLLKQVFRPGVCFDGMEDNADALR